MEERGEIVVLTNEPSTQASDTFAVEELTVLAELFGASRFPGVPDVHAGLPQQAREAALRSAWRGLVARGVVEAAANGGPALAGHYLDLVAVPLTAELVVAVERRDREQTYVRHFYAQPTTSVEHSLATTGIHRLTLFPTTELAARILEFSALEKRPANDATPLTVDAETFTVLREGVRLGDLSKARELLGADGSAFADAMESFASWCRITVLRRNGETVAGGDTTWIDAGDVLWRMEPDVSEPASARPMRVTISPCTARELADELVLRLAGEQDNASDE
jgi:hypothetical protein